MQFSCKYDTNRGFRYFANSLLHGTGALPFVQLPECLGFFCCVFFFFFLGVVLGLGVGFGVGGFVFVFWVLGFGLNLFLFAFGEALGWHVLLAEEPSCVPPSLVKSVIPSVRLRAF